ncbi:Type 4 prepilin-like proteins leader peptide-processing enzyme [Paraliobacillus sp. PM-2]|uniref:prepilin peptidase n=1 Tax=Paraliobacillus sp. PM-2 TaxID=1462524 RepID=UPI00061BFA83|nr:A24 family peptidase [Paraliobacillus sp. PM-2]CQR48014.1 Type 4 prepilin-like proteins leader peptide-processing enzyme [Paraliobacillus sp. PM-2]
MNNYFIITFFILGSVFGSFFNVVGLRVPMQNFLTSNRSYCPSCKRQLSWYELIPILSYAFQRGKCKGCKQHISIIYPFIELFTAFLFALSYSLVGFEIELIMALSLTSLVAIIMVTDLKYMVIPNKILLFFLPIFILIRFFSPLQPWWSSIVGALIGFFLIFFIILFSKGGMGAGDMKLFAILGVVLGYQGILLTFFIAVLLGSISSAILLLLKQVDRKTAIPFGPYICIAACITYFWGYDIINWYVTSFF